MLILVDGHNLIAALPDISLAEADDEEKLILKLRRYRARTGRQIAVFFDAGAAFQTAKKKSQGGLKIRYAPHNSTADRLIINRLKKIRNPAEVLVVTSDRAIQQAARRAKVRVMSSAEFVQELDILSVTISETQEITLSEEEVEEWLTLFNQKPT